MKTRFVLVMGVAGCGKTTVGELLAKHLGWNFYDADAFHPPGNIAKMATGTPLNDSDRAPWLAALHAMISAALKENRPGVLACSALKECYRQQLLKGCAGVQIVYLKGNYDLIWSRLSLRQDHFMRPHMLRSQFETLEEPKNALTLDVSMSETDLVGEILKQLE